MSSVQQETGSNELGRKRAPRSDKTRRSWTVKEEEVLLVLIKELVVQGWKSDNGFRAGYLNKLEDGMKQAFPGTDLKGLPHINSKISIWKKNYNSLSLMLEKSGAGFNVDGKHMIDCTDEQWELIMKRDTNARGMRYKSWPMYEEWTKVFGKDRATRTNAEDLMEVVNDMHRAEDAAQTDGHPPDYTQPQESPDKEPAEASVCQSGKGDAAGRSGGSKRKRDDELAGVYVLLGEISRNTDQRLETIANRIGYEFDLGKARKEVYEQLSNLQDLSMDRKLDVCETLVKEVALLELFIGLPFDAKERYVRRILEAKGKD